MTDYVYTSGGFPSSPTSGDSLVINGAYYDWTGGAWKIRNATPLRSEFIATANQATKTGLTYFVGSIDCYINGAKMLLGTDFTATNGTSVTFTPALDLDDEVQLIMGVSASSAAGASSLDSLSDTTVSTTDPTISINPTSGLGHIWINTTSGEQYILTDATAGDNAWRNVGDGSGSVTSIFVAPTATGGTVTTSGIYKIHTFTSSGDFVMSAFGSESSAPLDLLVVAGGGGGGGHTGGGGGAGGYRAFSQQNLGLGTFTATIGAGGTGSNNKGLIGSVTSITGNTISTISSIGGGGGGSYHGGVYDASSPAKGGDGGSGGGAGYKPGSYGSAIGLGTSGQGYAGGLASTTSYNCGGGGGSNGVGLDGVDNTTGGTGGIGTSNSITGTAVYYAGGGSGIIQSSRGSGITGNPAASGGGGYGGMYVDTLGDGSAGTVNTGGGGGGSRDATNSTGAGGDGGSGVVIIRYQYLAE